MLPVSGFVFGLLTVLTVIAVSSRLDHNVKSTTIVLFGMVFSLFVNALLTVIIAVALYAALRPALIKTGLFDYNVGCGKGK